MTRRVYGSVIAGALALCCSSLVARAQAPVLLQGVADGEFWSTTAKSNLLTRDNGNPSGLGRLQLWGAWQPLSSVVVYAQGRMETGRALPEQGKTFAPYSDRFGIQYIKSPSFVVDVGRLTPVVGTFAGRWMSTRNPLIGVPDGYSLEYPYGAEVSGELSHFDYRAALVSRPMHHVNYAPEPTERLRPAVGAGFTPFTGFRVGASYTAGPYLNDHLTATQLGGQPWTNFQQHVFGVDAAFSRGYLETHAEFAHGTYEVPGVADALVGNTYYGEVKYTFTPRFFVAGRAERNDYPFIRPTASATWIVRVTDFVNGEVGVGYRVKRNTLVKMSVRGDRWWVAYGAQGFRGLGGRAFAMQVSQAFDVMDWLRPRG